MPVNDFYKRLDAYRFIAVTLVILSHWIGFIKKHVNIGEVGVIMFFVLSGFLITNSILGGLKANSNRYKVLFNFYVKRVLRIFPLYYLVITVFYFFLKDEILLRNINYYLFYCVNFLILKIQQWPSHFSHFWSLSIEEQFYLLWPLIIIPFFNKRNVFAKIILIIIFLGLYLLESYKNFKGTFFLMNSLYCFLAIIAGALLSWCWNFEKVFLIQMRLHRMLPGILALFCLLYFFKSTYYFYAFFLLLSILNSLLLIIYLISCEDDKRLIFKWFWTNNSINYLGKISYGIYIYHNFMYFLFSIAGFDRELLFSSSKDYISYYIFYPFFYFLATILISILSWEFFEKPINNLKKYFSYY